MIDVSQTRLVKLKYLWTPNLNRRLLHIVKRLMMESQIKCANCEMSNMQKKLALLETCRFALITEVLLFPLFFLHRLSRC